MISVSAWFWLLVASHATARKCLQDAAQVNPLLPTIKVHRGGWLSQELMNAFAGLVLREMGGFPTEKYPPGDDSSTYWSHIGTAQNESGYSSYRPVVFDWMKNGYVDVAMEQWPEYAGVEKAYKDKYIKDGTMIDAGFGGSLGLSGWMVPEYMMKQYPALASYHALEESSMAGRFVCASADAHGIVCPMGTPVIFTSVPSYMFSRQTIKLAANLFNNLTVVSLESEERLEKVLGDYTANNLAILVATYHPSLLVTKFPLARMYLPGNNCFCSTSQCFLEAKCDFGVDLLYKYTSARLEKVSASAYQLIKEVKLDNDVIEGWMRVTEGDAKLTPEDAVCEWLKITENRAMVQRWMTKPLVYMDSSIVLYVLIGISIAVNLAIVFTLVRFRAHPIIRATSVPISLVFAGAAFACLFSIIPPSVYPPTKATCVAETPFMHLSFITLLTCLNLKLWQLCKIFNLFTKHLATNMLVFRDLLLRLLLIMTPVLAYVVTWVAVDPPIPVHRETLRHSVVVCTCNEFWPVPLLAAEIILLVTAAMLCVLARNLPKLFNETSSIAISVYTALLLFGFAALVGIFFSESNPMLFRYTVIIAMLVLINTTMGFMFLPRLVKVMNGAQIEQTARFSTRDFGKSARDRGNSTINTTEHTHSPCMELQSIDSSIPERESQLGEVNERENRLREKQGAKVKCDACGQPKVQGPIF